VTMGTPLELGAVRGEPPPARGEPVGSRDRLQERRASGGASRARASRGVAAVALALAACSPFRVEEENVRAGHARLLAGDPAGALSRYDAAERAVGRRPEIDHARGNAAFRLGRLEAARDAYLRAVEGASPALASRALQNLANVLAAAGDRDGAARALADALSVDPTNEDARWNLEVLLLAERTSPEPGAHRGEPSPERAGAPGRDARGERAGGDDPARPPRPSGAPESERPERQGGAPAPGVGDEPARREPLSRERAEAILDALRARERGMPFSGPAREERRADAKDW
jgi:tetratricopeptide (TPR) repeat protein